MIVILLVATLAYVLLMGGGARGIPYQLSLQITVHGCPYLATYIANAQRQSLYIYKWKNQIRLHREKNHSIIEKSQ